PCLKRGGDPDITILENLKLLFVPAAIYLRHRQKCLHRCAHEIGGVGELRSGSCYLGEHLLPIRSNARKIARKHRRNVRSDMKEAFLHVPSGGAADVIVWNPSPAKAGGAHPGVLL